MADTPLDTSRLQALRLDHGLTLTDLAKAAHITVGYMSLIEAGKRKGRPAVIKRIADALGVAPEQLHRTAA